MKVRHVFIFTCYAMYFLVFFVINYFGIDAGIGAGIILGSIGVVLFLFALIVFLEWLGKNWNRDVKLCGKNKS